MKDLRLVVIARPGLSAGFALAGVPVFDAMDGGGAARQIHRVLEAGNAGVVMVDERLFRDLPDEVSRDLQRSAHPVVIPVPGPDWAEESTAHEYIVDILRRAIGYRVRLQ